MTVLPWAFAGTLGILGCTASAASTATLHASERWSCPAERLELQPQGVVAEPEDPAPPDIAADPERYALWRKSVDDARQEKRLFRVSGCGQTDLLECAYGNHGRSRGWACHPFMPAPRLLPATQTPETLAAYFEAMASDYEAIRPEIARVWREKARWYREQTSPPASP
jgi:hypothetical protein